MAYDHADIERKWQEYWREHGTFAAPDKPANKYYALDMFPYPSGAGLHVGHPKGYTATDIVSRMRRAQGYDVLHPMGWDAFGLPAENYAIKTGTAPQETTARSIVRFREQLQRLGFSYDWNKELATSDPSFYKWTQWIFLQLFERGLAYQKEAAVNWCPKDQTVLANEQVVGGCCERCGTEVVQRQLKQWFFKITDYADELLADLDALDWPEAIKAAQRNWIGKSEGARIGFPLEDRSGSLEVFTTRPETLYGVTYLIVAPEHPLVAERVARPDAPAGLAEYAEQARRKTERDRKMDSGEKTGVFTGCYATHPLTGERLPVWTADYVLGSYGTGAVMAVPAHDARDWAFAAAHGLPVHTVVSGGTADAVYEDAGTLVASGDWTGKHSEADRSAIIMAIEAAGIGTVATQYRIRDWLVSRQRYWGAPIPIIHCDACGIQPVPFDQLPVRLPEDVDFLPTGESPLARSASFHDVACPRCGGAARRESDTMDTFVDSSWYFLRYPDPRNDAVAFVPGTVAHWLPVDLYVGGAEHAVLHLLYARFVTKALDDIVGVGFREPFRRLKNVGLILGEDGRKMSKSLGNVINPDDVVDRYGADTLRLYEMFMGPFEDYAPWNTGAMVGIRRWLDRIWRLQDRVVQDAQQEAVVRQRAQLSKLTRLVTDHIDGFKFNTAVSALMIQTNAFMDEPAVSNEAFSTFTQLLAPFAPHLAEELWQRLGNADSIAHAPWPVPQAETADERCTIVVQVQGKVRGTMTLRTGAGIDEAIAEARQLENVARHLGDSPWKTVFVPNKLVNFIPM